MEAHARRFWKSGAEWRELHDGVAQELSFIVIIVTKSRGLSEGLSEPSGRELDHLAAAAERALDELRRAITAVSAPTDDSLETALAQTVKEVANRVGARTEVVVDPDVDVPAATKEALLRFAREASSTRAVTAARGASASSSPTAPGCA